LKDGGESLRSSLEKKVQKYKPEFETKNEEDLFPLSFWMVALHEWNALRQYEEMKIVRMDDWLRMLRSFVVADRIHNSLRSSGEGEDFVRDLTKDGMAVCSEWNMERLWRRSFLVFRIWRVR
jgi:hypothetical protein